LIEVRAKRAAFLRHITTTLPLTNVAVHRARFEDVVSELGLVDWITLQGVALSRELLDSAKRISSSTTNIVWISSPGVMPPLSPTRTLQVPSTGTQVFLFRLRG
jgi:16S rRNA G527 N7-methylase RsmG